MAEFKLINGTDNNDTEVDNEKEYFLSLKAQSFEITQENTTPVYCSIPVESTKDKKYLYKITMNPDYTLSDFINKPIEVSNIYVDVNEMIDKDPDSETYGEVLKKPRTILIDKEGKSYVAGVSIGVFRAVKEILKMFGDPATWDESMVITPALKKTPKGNMITLNVD